MMVELLSVPGDHFNDNNNNNNLEMFIAGSLIHTKRPGNCNEEKRNPWSNFV
jgi:hypothetical protein